MTTPLICGQPCEHTVVEAYRLDRYDNFPTATSNSSASSCRSLSFG